VLRCGDKRIAFDDEIIRRYGIFVVSDLKSLNAAALKNFAVPPGGIKAPPHRGAGM